MRRHPSLTLAAILGLTHAAADGSAGLIVGSLSRALAPEQIVQLVVLYNVIAFGGQPLAGLVVDRFRRPRAAAVCGTALMIAALLLQSAPVAAVVLAGAGSALFHVGAGALALCATPGRAAGPGLFAAPGVVGLAVGGALAASGHVFAAPFVAALAILGAILVVMPLPAMPYRADRDEPLFEGHDYVMLVLLVAIALRSAVWNVFQIAMAGRTDLLVVLACAAAVGKALGGLLADRIGWRRWTIGALGLAAPTLAVSGDRIVPLMVGIALLQSATAPMLALVAQAAPRSPGPSCPWSPSATSSPG